MRRRNVLQLAAAGLVGLTGCTSNADESTSEATVESVSITAENHTPDDPTTSLSLRYATRTTKTIDAPESPTRTADEGAKFVILHGELTVESDLDGEIDVYAPLSLLVDNVVHDAGRIIGTDSLDQSVVAPATISGWEYFEVPANATTATLTAGDIETYYSRPTALTFTASDELSASFE
jgi:hypothetical protein